MTAFEILLNKYYETIENNEPKSKNKSKPGLTFELNKIIKDFVNTSFNNGHNLSYKKLIDKMMEESAVLFKNSNYEDWARVKYVFQQNDLHYIRRDRNFREVENLKVKLEQMF